MTVLSRPTILTACAWGLLLALSCPAQIRNETGPPGNVDALTLGGSLIPGETLELRVDETPGALASVFFGPAPLDRPLPPYGQQLIRPFDRSLPELLLTLDASGRGSARATMPVSLPGLRLFAQALLVRPGGGVVLSNRSSLGVPGASGLLFEDQVLTPFSTHLPRAGQLAAHDLDGDGFLDLILADQRASALLLSYGSADGSFSAWSSLAMPATPSSAAAGDLDGDGFVDLAVGLYSQTGIAIFHGTAGGGFVAGPTLLTGEGFRGLLVADLDRDGRPDLAGASLRYDELAYWRNAGGGSFPVQRRRPTAEQPERLHARDLDGDGWPDLVVTHERGRELSLYANDGRGLFLGEQRITGVDARRAAVFGDFDGNGSVEVLVPGASNDLVWVEAVAPRVFAQTRTTPLSFAAEALAAGDTDGDGFLDVVAKGFQNRLGLLLGRGGGAFAAPEVLFEGGDVRAMELLHLDADGHLDLLGLDRRNWQVHVRHGRAAGLSRSAATLSRNGPGDAVIADVTGDGRPDIVTADYKSDTVSLIPGLGAGGFGAPASFAAGTRPTRMVLVDLDADGREDLVTANEGSGDLSVLPGLGAAGFGTELRVPLIDEPVELVAGDFDRDGDLDLCVLTLRPGGGTLEFFDGDGALGLVAASTRAVGNFPTGLAYRDLDGDGTRDLVVVNTWDADISLLPGRAGGGFAPSMRIPTGATGQGLVVEDMTGDGILDLVLSHRTGVGHEVHLLPGTGGAAFGTPRTQPVPDQVIGLTVGDLDADGRRDVVVRGGNSRLVTLFGAAGGGLSPARTFLAGESPARLVLADLDADGLEDVLSVGYFELLLLRNVLGGRP